MLRSILCVTAGFILAAQLSLGQDKVYSGPQTGEPVTSFKVLSFQDPASPVEKELSPTSAGGPVTLVFLHTLERSLVPLLRAIDSYAGERKNALRTEVVLLAADRISGEQRTRAVLNSLKLKSPASLSLDGPEGPGNYGLNKECMMTIVIANDGKVTDNFALVQPGIADAPAVIKAMAKVSGDPNPPTAEMLASRHATRRAPNRMREEMSRGATGRNPRERPRASEEKFPGAVPTDEKLVTLFRQFIRRTNDDARVDRVLAQVKAHIEGKPELRKQAVDGWTRILHFGERYGTPYAREQGAKFLEELKSE